MFWRGVAFLEGACSVLEGCGIIGGRLLSFGGVWHFWRTVAAFWRGVVFGEATCSGLEGCGISRGHLQCFGGVWHFGEAACSVLGRQEALVQHFGGAW